MTFRSNHIECLEAVSAAAPYRYGSDIDVLPKLDDHLQPQNVLIHGYRCIDETELLHEKVVPVGG